MATVFVDANPYTYQFYIMCTVLSVLDLGFESGYFYEHLLVASHVRFVNIVGLLTGNRELKNYKYDGVRFTYFMARKFQYQKQRKKTEAIALVSVYVLVVINNILKSNGFAVLSVGRSEINMTIVPATVGFSILFVLENCLGLVTSHIFAKRMRQLKDEALRNPEVNPNAASFDDVQSTAFQKPSETSTKRGKAEVSLFEFSQKITQPAEALKEVKEGDGEGTFVGTNEDLGVQSAEEKRNTNRSVEIVTLENFQNKADHAAGKTFRTGSDMKTLSETQVTDGPGGTSATTSVLESNANKIGKRFGHLCILEPDVEINMNCIWKSSLKHRWLLFLTMATSHTTLLSWLVDADISAR